jgi:hypothetical protein
VNPISRLVSACATSLVFALAWGCSEASSGTVVKSPTPSAAKAVSPGYKWLSVDLPDQFSSTRSEVYDRVRDCLWVMSGFSQGASEAMTLTRVNVTDRSTVNVLTMAVENYDTGLIAIDSHDILWMGWGWTLTRFDPDTRTTKSWTRPAYSGLARLYSGDGRMVGMTIDSKDEIWVAAGMVSAVFGFNTRASTWDRPINLTFVPVGGSVLAAPSAGIVTISGVGLDAKYSPRFAVIRAATHSVKTFPLRAWQYVATGDGAIVYSDGTGNIRRMNLKNGSSTVIGTTQVTWYTSANMALDVRGDIWFQAATGRFTGVAKLNPTTGAVSQFLFPIVIRFYEPVPSPRPPCFGDACLPVECQVAEIFRCVATPESLDPQVQGMATDAHGNLWMVTQAASVDLSYPYNSIYAPVVELQTGG